MHRPAERAYLDTTAFIAALGTLTDADRIRLRYRAASLAPGTGMQGDDLFQEAVRRALEREDGRRCPCDVPVPAFLSNVMRSIASAEREKYARQVSLDPNDNDCPAGDPHPSHVLDSANARIDLQRIVARLEELFADDPQAQAVLIGTMENWTPVEIRDLEPMDDLQYAAARRRFRRAILNEFGKDGKK